MGFTKDICKAHNLWLLLAYCHALSAVVIDLQQKSGMNKNTVHMCCSSDINFNNLDRMTN